MTSFFPGQQNSYVYLVYFESDWDFSSKPESCKIIQTSRASFAKEGKSVNKNVQMKFMFVFCFVFLTYSMFHLRAILSTVNWWCPHCSFVWLIQK